MEKMTKSGFWDQIERDFPELMADFKSWVDEWKRRVDWEHLFPFQLVGRTDDIMGKYYEQYPLKFHHLPNAMQIGIFIQYTIERGGASFFGNYWNMEDHVNGVRAWFHEEKRLADLDAIG